MTGVVVACCQFAPVLGDLAVNRQRSAELVTSAAARGASIVVLPELVSSGYVFESAAEVSASAETADGETVTGWARLAAEHGIVIVGGFCEASGDEVFNSAALVDPDGIRSVYRKAHLWNDEKRWFSPGSAAPPVVATRFGRIAMVICYDLEFPEWVRLPALDGAQLLCAPTNWPAAYGRPDGERPAEVVRVQANAAVNRMFIAACDRTGEERGVGWVGGSVIVDADGWPLAATGQAAGHNPATVTGGPVTIAAECQLGEAMDKSIGPKNDVHADRRPELYGRVAGPPAPSATSDHAIDSVTQSPPPLR
ncbi:MAG TPA: nitrilase family protein [Streptosporangiaceae bacterium]